MERQTKNRPRVGRWLVLGTILAIVVLALNDNAIQKLSDKFSSRSQGNMGVALLNETSPAVTGPTESCFADNNLVKNKILDEGTRTSGFFSMAYFDGKLYGGTYNNEGRNHIQVKTLPNGTPVDREINDANAQESFYRFAKIGASRVIAVTEAVRGSIWAWNGSSAWSKIYTDPDQGILRGIIAYDSKVFVSAYEITTGVSKIRYFNQAAVEAAQSLTASTINDPLETIGFLNQGGVIYAFGNKGLGTLVKSGTTYSIQAISSCASGSGSSKKYDLKNAIFWKNLLWISGQKYSNGNPDKPALYTFDPANSGLGCVEAFVPSTQQMANRKDYEKFWALASKGDELFVSTICFDNTQCGESSGEKEKSAIFKCFDSPGTTANECKSGAANWKPILTLEERGIKDMQFIGSDLYVAGNNAKENWGGKVWKNSCQTATLPDDTFSDLPTGCTLKKTISVRDAEHMDEAKETFTLSAGQTLKVGMKKLLGHPSFYVTNRTIADGTTVTKDGKRSFLKQKIEQYDTWSQVNYSLGTNTYVDLPASINPASGVNIVAFSDTYGDQGALALLVCGSGGDDDDDNGGSSFTDIPAGCTQVIDQTVMGSEIYDFAGAGFSYAAGKTLKIGMKATTGSPSFYVTSSAPRTGMESQGRAYVKSELDKIKTWVSSNYSGGETYVNVTSLTAGTTYWAVPFSDTSGDQGAMGVFVCNADGTGSFSEIPKMCEQIMEKSVTSAQVYESSQLDLPSGYTFKVGMKANSGSPSFYLTNQQPATNMAAQGRSYVKTELDKIKVWSGSTSGTAEAYADVSDYISFANDFWAVPFSDAVGDAGVMGLFKCPKEDCFDCAKARVESDYVYEATYAGDSSLIGEPKPFPCPVSDPYCLPQCPASDTERCLPYPAPSTFVLPEEIEDQIDISLIPESHIVGGNDTKVLSRPITSSLEYVELEGDKVRFGVERMREGDEEWRWKDVDFGEGGTNGNPWVFAKIDGEWYGAVWEWLREGTEEKTVVLPEIGRYTKTAPFKCWVPKPGDQVGFMISSLARSSARSAYDERSNILVITWPKCCECEDETDTAGCVGVPNANTATFNTTPGNYREQVFKGKGKVEFDIKGLGSTQTQTQFGWMYGSRFTALDGGSRFEAAIRSDGFRAIDSVGKVCGEDALGFTPNPTSTYHAKMEWDQLQCSLKMSLGSKSVEYDECFVPEMVNVGAGSPPCLATGPIGGQISNLSFTSGDGEDDEICTNRASCESCTLGDFTNIPDNCVQITNAHITGSQLYNFDYNGFDYVANQRVKIGYKATSGSPTFYITKTRPLSGLTTKDEVKTELDRKKAWSLESSAGETYIDIPSSIPTGNGYYAVVFDDNPNNDLGAIGTFICNQTTNCKSQGSTCGVAADCCSGLSCQKKLSWCGIFPCFRKTCEY